MRARRRGGDGGGRRADPLGSGFMMLTGGIDAADGKVDIDNFVLARRSRLRPSPCGGGVGDGGTSGACAQTVR